METDIGAGTKPADVSGTEIMKKRKQEEIDRLQDKIEYQEKYIPHLEKMYELNKQDLSIKKEVGKITKKYPKKLEPEYEFEKQDKYHELMTKRQKVIVDRELLDAEFKLEETKKQLEEYKKTLESNKGLLEHKKKDLDNIGD